MPLSLSQYALSPLAQSISTASYTTSVLIGLFLVILFAVLSVFVWLWAMRRPSQSHPAPDESAPEPPQEPTAPVYVAVGLSNIRSIRGGSQGDDWPDLLHAMMPAGTDYVKLGADDRTLAESNTQSLAAAINAKPLTLTFWQVAGDATGGTSLPAYLKDLRVALHRLVEETPATVFLLNLPDLSLILEDATEERKSLVRGGVEQWNRVIAEVAMPHGNRVRLVDLYPHSREILDWQSGNSALAGVVWQAVKAATQ